MNDKGVSHQHQTAGAADGHDKKQRGEKGFFDIHGENLSL